MVSHDESRLYDVDAVEALKPKCFSVYFDCNQPDFINNACYDSECKAVFFVLLRKSSFFIVDYL